MNFNTGLLFVFITFDMLTHEAIAYFFWPDHGCDFMYERGPCDKYLFRWWHNQTSRICESFIYGGCEGNENNYKYEAACIKACVPERLFSPSPINMNVG